MALSNPRIIFGIHSMTPSNRSTGLPYGILKVVGSAGLSLSADLEQLFAGSNKFAWAAESKTVSTEITAKVKAYPGFMFELFLGATVTDTGADTAGVVSVPVEINGTTIMGATTGLASVGILSGSKANLKFGKYALKATAAKVLAIYCLTDIDFARGTDETFDDDNLVVGTATIVDTGGTTDVATLGLQFTGGSGTIAFTIGDTATFEILPPSSKSSLIVVGAASTSFPAFKNTIMAQKRATDEIFEIEAPNCVGAGLPITMEEFAFSQPEVKMQALYDSTTDCVFRMRHFVA